MTKSAKNMGRLKFSEHKVFKKHHVLPPRIAHPFGTCRSRGNSFLLPEVGHTLFLHGMTGLLPPTFAGREPLMHSIAVNDVTIILGETGSGKTTRTSQYCIPLLGLVHVLAFRGSTVPS
jgi:hypothetical protein